MRWRWLAFSLLFLNPQTEAQERRVYEGVVDLKKQTIGTVVLLEITENSVSGWIRLEKFVPLEGGSATEDSAEFRAAGNQYRIEERKGKITYSGPDGAASRYITRLERWTGPLAELLEATRATGAAVAAVEVRGRRRELRYGRPALWKQKGPPFEAFSRLEELLGKEISVWAASADDRIGRLVVVEEPSGMDIPLKAPKKPKNEKK